MKKNAFLGDLKTIGKNVKWIIEEINKDDIEISESAFYKKMRGDSEFKTSEIKSISKIMNYSREKMMDIFFEEIVSQKTPKVS